MYVDTWRKKKFNVRYALLAAVVVLVVAAFLIAAGATDGAAAAKLRLSFLPIADCVSFFAAKDRGFFKKEGLEIEAKIVGGGVVALPAVKGGSLEIGWSDTLALINFHAKGFDAQYFAPGGPLASARSTLASPVWREPMTGASRR